MYAPPEQFAGAPVTPASDIYAATATFYECPTGRPPFEGDTADALLYQHMSQPVPLGPVPEPLRPLIAAGMAKEPGDRPADGTTFVAALEAAASGAYGRDWEERGRSHLGEAALLLAALWPAGASPAIQGSAVDRVSLSPESKDSLESRHLRHLWHLRHLKRHRRRHRDHPVGYFARHRRRPVHLQRSYPMRASGPGRPGGAPVPFNLDATPCPGAARCRARASARSAYRGPRAGTPRGYTERGPGRGSSGKPGLHR